VKGAVLGAIAALVVACAGPEAEIARQESAQAHYEIGIGALAENNLSKAIGELQIAVQEDPRNARHHHALGNAYLRNRQADRAIAAFLRATELEPRMSDALNDLGVAYMQQQQWEPAIAAFRKALANPQYLNPERAYTNLGNIFYHRGQFEEATEEFRKLQDVLPQSPDGYFFLGRTLLAQGKLNEAREQLERAIKIDGTIAIFHFELGMVLMRGGQRSQAKESFRRALDLSPSGPEADEARRYLRQLN
jgi:superkiller protein 3